MTTKRSFWPLLLALAASFAFGVWLHYERPGTALYDLRPAGPRRACLFEGGRLVQCFPFKFPPAGDARPIDEDPQDASPLAGD